MSFLFPASRERLVHQRQDYFHVLTLRGGIVAVLRGPRPDVNLGIERLSFLIQKSCAAVVSPDGVTAF